MTGVGEANLVAERRKRLEGANLMGLVAERRKRLEGANLMGLVAERRKRLDGASLSGSPAPFFRFPIALVRPEKRKAGENCDAVFTGFLSYQNTKRRSTC